MVRSLLWTRDEDERLRKLAAAGTSVAKIAKQLKRGRSEIRSRAYQLKVPVGLKHAIANTIEKVLQVNIVPDGQLFHLFEIQQLKQLLRNLKVDCVFDVGANVGQYAQMLRWNVGFTGTIISFEPNPNAAAKLRKAAFADPFWHVEEIALDKETGSRTFNIMVADEFSSLLHPDHSSIQLFLEMNTVAKTVLVRTERLDTVLNRLRSKFQFKRPFLKLDSQGNDLNVALGASESIRQFVGLQSELSIRPIYVGAPSYQEVLNYYLGEGFVLSAFVPNNVGHFPDLVEVDCIMYNKRFAAD